MTEEQLHEHNQKIMSNGKPSEKNATAFREFAKEQETQNMRDFKDYCCKAFHHLRQNSNQLINLFLIMLSAGMPELQKNEHIEELVKALEPNASEQEANKKMKDF